MIDGKELDTFFLAFVGQSVIISTEIIVPGSDGEVYPLFYEGILLDYDNEYYYLGETPNEINQCIRKEPVLAIKVREEVDELKEFLDQLPVPQKKEDIN